MAAGLGFKTFTTGEVLTAADVNGYLMQGVLVFANAAARDAAITSPQEGQFAYTKDNNSLWYYTGSAWAASGATGDIEGVTAGVGISGGGTSGTVTITNDMATTITASGDIVVGTGSGTYDNLPIGSTGQVLTADTTVSPYKVKWAAPAAASFVGCLASRTSNLSLTQNVVTKSTFNATDTYDTNNFHDTSTNNTRLTVPSGYGGYYLLFCADVDMGTSASGYICFLKNNAIATPTNQYTMNYVRNTGGNNINLTMAFVISAAAGDYFELALITDGVGYVSARAAFGCVYLGA